MQINGLSSQFSEVGARLPSLNQSASLEGLGGPLTQGVEVPDNPKENLRQAFHDFVGQTFFAELIKSYRSTQQPSKYFHGGQAEKIFQGQLDQVLTEALSDRTAQTIADPMFDLFMAKRF